ncbi:Mitochondrial carrier domain [Pseudocohnilembus persalinus]|uniref:malate dehydrogenase n=1 Tax=Pseudocohnilembus persalinus TaxID=266149 RepID=A0A0V0R395_PSEPJ|nr:Mitochondrial carrier domain [Pseudocohnilembus persalinus]|eukprot:KRX08925.1 Mitochondrial carrier domain [Pseudocohnilembus persalinus]
MDESQDEYKRKLHYQQIFNEIDRKKNGYIDILDFRFAMHQLQLPPVPIEKQKELFKQMDKKKTGNIDLDEFQAFMEKRQSLFEEAYKQISNTQYINKWQIREILDQLKIEASDEDIRHFMRSISTNRDRVSFEDFQKYFALMPEPIDTNVIFEQFFRPRFMDDVVADYMIPFELDDDIEFMTKEEMYRKMAFGAISGCTSRTLTAPIDRIKIEIQTNIDRVKIKNVAKEVYKFEGIRGFFKGNGVNCFKIAPETALKYIAFDYAKKYIAEDPFDATPLERFLCGGISGVAAQFMIYPLEITKTRMILRTPGQYKGILDCMKHMVKQKGFTSLYDGLTPSLMGVFPYAGIVFAANTLLREKVCEHFGQNKAIPSVPIMMSCTIVACTFGMFVTAPFNLIRTRLQSNGILPYNAQYKGIFDCISRTKKKEGYLGFFKGNGLVFGENQLINLRLLDVEQCQKILEGVKLELEDCAYKLVKSIEIGFQPEKIFQDADIAIFLGGYPRKPGMERKDLLEINNKIFKIQGQALNKYAKPTCKSLVIANPANTNCLTLAKQCTNIPKKNFTCLTRLDQNRAYANIALKTDSNVKDVKNIVIWGNHSATQFPDVAFGTVKGQKINEVVDKEYLQDQFITRIQKRGAEILQARNGSSVMSAANAVKDHFRSWYFGTQEGEFVSMGIYTENFNNLYGIPDDMVFSVPLKCKDFEYEVVKDLELDEFQREKIGITLRELQEEKEESQKQE